ncbi:MAG: right-handed parallel beta-helix repeat-containing protein [Cyclobacteriaceae bacterium]
MRKYYLKVFTIILFVLYSSIIVAQSRIYYVSSSSGNDGNNGLSSSRAWKTISKVNRTSLRPGDKVLFKKGDRWNEELRPGSSGSSGKHIVFGAYGSGKLPIISPKSGSYSVNIRVKSYIKIENLHVIGPTTGNGIAVRGNSRGNIITNCKVEGNSSNRSHSGIVFSGQLEGGLPGGTLVTNNQVSGFFQCIYGYGGLRSAGRIENNTILNARDDGIAARRGDFRNLVIRGNKITYCRDDGIDLFGGINIIVENNDISKLPSGSIVAGNGIKAGGGTAKSENVTVRYNIVHDLTHSSNSLKIGITTNGGDKIKIYGNLIYNVDGQAISVPTGSNNVDIYNNTAISRKNHSLFIGSSQGSRIRNNIFWGQKGNLNINTSVASQNNLLIGGVREDKYKSRNDVIASASEVFANHSSRDYRLKSSSPAIDRGTSISGFSRGLNGVSVSGATDIGAYQHGKSSARASTLSVNLRSEERYTLPVNKIEISAGVTTSTSISSHSWRKVSGPSIKMSDEGVEKLVLSNLVPGTFRFRLTVKDITGKEASDEVGFTISKEETNTPPQNNPDPEPEPDPTPTNAVAGINYTYYEGSWTRIPSFGNLKARKTGTVSSFTLSPRLRSEHFGFRFEGYIRITRQGSYRFYTTSDDGSRLSINGRRIVDNDGRHSARERSGSVSLSPGYHKIVVEFFESTKQEVLKVSYQGPGISKRTVPSSVLFRNKPSNARTESTAKVNNDQSTGFKSDLSEELDVVKDSIISVYPIPFKKDLFMELSTSEKAQFVVEILDLSGKSVTSQTYQLTKGAQKIQVDTKELYLPGYYILRAYRNGKIEENLKILKK